MSTIAESVTLEQFKQHILPYLSTAKRGYVSKTSLCGIFNLMLYRLHTGCQWKRLPDTADAGERECRGEPSWQAVYDHWSQWSANGSLKRVWQQSLLTVQPELDLSVLNLAGSHAIAKKGGQSVAYQARKRAKTSNILPITARNGYVVASTGIVAGNHNDAYDLKAHLPAAFKSLKQLGLSIVGALFNADSAFDTRDARKVCFNHQLVPNMAENKRNRKYAKRGPQRRFHAQVYKERCVSERSFAWIDKFRALLVRFDIKEVNFLAGHHLAFALINLRHLFAAKV